jgi:hypothetical protein
LDARFKNLIIKTLRTLSYRWPPRTEAKARAKVDKALYRCECNCGTYCYEGSSDENYMEYVLKYPKNKILREKGDMDHISPVVSLEGNHPYLDWNIFIERLFCKTENYQYLAKPCHKTKSKAENKLRQKS